MFFCGRTIEKKKQKNYIILENIPEPHEIQKKIIKNSFLMFSAGQYRSTVKGYDKFF